MSSIRPIRCLLVPLCFLVSIAGKAEVKPRDAFDARIAGELRSADPEAADMFEEANRARESGDKPQDRRGEALALCREAYSAEKTPENRASLIEVLVSKGGNSRDTEEAIKLSSQLLSDRETDPLLLSIACHAAVEGKNRPLLDRCILGTSARAPNEASTHFFVWIREMSDSNYGRALAALDRAHELGLPDEAYAQFRATTEKATPFWVRHTRGIVALALGWLASMPVLLLAGTLLSRLTLEAARRPAPTQDGQSAGLSGSLRRTYQAVLWASCAYYYVSLPLVLLVVLLVGGGVVYAFVSLGRVPVKLLLMVVIGVAVTLWAGVKSLFVRGRDQDPGDRLDLGPHPRLRAVLDEVAAKIGTRPTDNVYMTPGTDLAVMERGGLLRQLRGNTERCLILGVGVLDGMKLHAFHAVLAHEYGHFSNRDTAGGGFALSVRRSMGTMAQALASGGSATWYNPAWIFLNSFHRIFLRISQGASRLQEVLADRWAAFAYGAAAFEQGLRHVIERSIRFDLHAQATLKDVVDGQRPLANLYTYVPASAILQEDEVLQAVERAIDAKPSPYDSHPAPRQRFELVHALGAGSKSEGDDGEDAWALFSNREEVQRWMTERVRENVAQAHGVKIAAEKGEGSAG